MRTRSASVRTRTKRVNGAPNDGRKARMRFLHMEGLEPRTLLATIPAPTATASVMNLSGLSSVSSGGNANSPAVAIDPYNPNIVVAVWSVDLSSLTTVPHTTAIVEAAFSNNAGSTWSGSGLGGVATPLTDPTTIDSSPPTAYTQVTDPSVGFDANGDAYFLSLQTSATNDGALFLTEFHFTGTGAPTQVSGIANGGIVYQWVSGSDAATSPVVAVDASKPNDGFANNVYIAWASIDTEPANTAPYTNSGFNPNRAELVVGTPSSTPGQESLAFSGVLTVNAGGNSSKQADSHPQLVINQNSNGQVVVGWDDFGTAVNTGASPLYDNLMSNFVAPGDSSGFVGGTGAIAPATTANSVVTKVMTPFSDVVSGVSSTVDDLTVTIDLTDQETVQNLQLDLVAPGGTAFGPGSIELVRNQDNEAGTADTTVGLPSGNAIGVYGFTTGATGTRGTDVGTVFDDNATRNIYDATSAVPQTNGNSATDYIGYFRPEIGSLELVGQVPG